MEQSLKDFIDSKGYKITSVQNPDKVFAYVSTSCYHSKEGCKIIASMNVNHTIYAVDKNKFVSTDMGEQPGNFNADFPTYYTRHCNHMNSWCKNTWKYPHVFFCKDNKWYYIGGHSNLRDMFSIKL
tara:strand:+ start:178 stop:555 length:378 start_codon:yes stop_codon:yes gene_type:complete